MKTKKSDSKVWTVIFSDLLSLLITMFIAIYALSDQKPAQIMPEIPKESIFNPTNSKSSLKEMTMSDEAKVAFNYILINLFSKIKKEDAEVIKGKNFLSITFKKPYMLSNDGNINENGSVALATIVESMEYPPSRIESSSENNIRDACTAAKFISAFTEKSTWVTCVLKNNEKEKNTITITLLE